MSNSTNAQVVQVNLWALVNQKGHVVDVFTTRQEARDCKVDGSEKIAKFEFAKLAR